MILPLLALSGSALAVGSADAPTEVEASRIQGRTGVEVNAEGDASLRRSGVELKADSISYRELTDEAVAEGNVELRQGTDVMRGPAVRLKVQEQVGEFDSPSYSITRNTRVGQPGEEDSRTVAGGGSADKLHFEGENQYRLEGATWSTCPAPDPDWYIRAGELKLDYDREVGVARNGSVVFKDVPIFYLPWIEFPLVGQRQSGLLAPTVGQSNKTGFDLTLPYYWNIAPNYDATLTPRYMSRRGVQLGGEFRYLTEKSRGQTQLEWLPDDAERGGSRAAGSFRHLQDIAPGWTTSINLNRVSDVDYFSDLSSRLAVTSQSNLLNRAEVRYAGGEWWDASMIMQGYQTIDGVAPYRMLPRLALNASRELGGGTQFDFRGDTTYFEHRDDAMAKGQRTVLYPQVSWPLLRDAYSLTPKLGVHYTRYELETPQSAGAPTSLTRSLPIASLDGQLNFERQVEWRGREYRQTLEPRLYYLYVPYRRQDPDQYPVFDSAAYDYNFTQVFSENIYTGDDRIANANQVTAAVTSRMLDRNGVELMRGAVGQRYYFEDQRVQLSGSDPLRTGRRADLLAALSGLVHKDTRLSTDLQYNPRDNWAERFNLGVSYQPDFAKVVNASFRYTRDVLRDLDLAAQWPLGRNWYGVMRYTRSLREHRVTEALGGVEYNGGCWVLRAALYRFATNQDDVTQALYLQLELNGLASVGASPVNLLRRSVQGYGKINDLPADPVFGQE
ncbi:MAG: LPS-assembly protein LptD [Rhodocyclaceae bacterium]|nr:LPS-assembly protein LptD [Rhodocyclaceae bacterium]MCP5308769.1 LPS-assembly protein LptD [Zoogloeaceae bacterium]